MLRGVAVRSRVGDSGDSIQFEDVVYRGSVRVGFW